MIFLVEFSAFPTAKKIADKTPMVEAARVSASCSFTWRLGIDLTLHSHSGYAGVRVFEPHPWCGDSSDLSGSQLVNGEV